MTPPGGPVRGGEKSPNFVPTGRVIKYPPKCTPPGPGGPPGDPPAGGPPGAGQGYPSSVSATSSGWWHRRLGKWSLGPLKLPKLHMPYVPLRSLSVRLL